MKYLIFSVLLLLCPDASAQSTREQKAMLERDLNTYRRVSLALNFDSIFQFLPPAMFEIVPRDSLKEMMLSMMENKDLSMIFTKLDYKGKHKVKKAGDHYYSLIQYDGGMDIKLKEEADETFITILKTVMKRQFGSDNVVAEGKSLLHITMPDKQLIGFKTRDDQHWYFVEDKRASSKPSELIMMDSIVPEAVRKALD